MASGTGILEVDFPPALGDFGDFILQMGPTMGVLANGPSLGDTTAGDANMSPGPNANPNPNPNLKPVGDKGMPPGPR